jgi:hypothetical protein
MRSRPCCHVLLQLHRGDTDAADCSPVVLRAPDAGGPEPRPGEDARGTPDNSRLAKQICGDLRHGISA